MPEILLHLLTLTGGLITLAVASNLLVRGTVSIGTKLGIPQLIVGVFIVGFGTSVPEILVVVNSVVSGYYDIAVGTIVGSNIANLWFVLVIPALFTSIPTNSPDLKFAFYTMIFVTIVWVITTAFTPIHAFLGLTFLVLLLLYAFATFQIQKRAEFSKDVAGHDNSKTSVMVGLTILSLVLLPVGSNWIVDGSVGVAKALSVPEEIIGLTLVAVGTSLPEIGAGVAAAIQKRPNLIIGNVVGSHIFNLLGAGGFAALFAPIIVPSSIANYSHWVMIISALTLLPFVVFGKPIGKRSSSLLLLLYFVYVFGLARGWQVL